MNACSGLFRVRRLCYLPMALPVGCLGVSRLRKVYKKELGLAVGITQPHTQPPRSVGHRQQLQLEE